MYEQLLATQKDLHKKTSDNEHALQDKIVLMYESIYLVLKQINNFKKKTRIFMILNVIGFNIIFL